MTQEALSKYFFEVLMSNQIVLAIKNVLLRSNRLLFYLSSLAFFLFLSLHINPSQKLYENANNLSIIWLPHRSNEQTKASMTSWSSDCGWSEVMGNLFPCTLLGGYKSIFCTNNSICYNSYSRR